MVRKNINFNRAKYYAVAAVLLSSSMPIVPLGNAWADSTPLTQNLELTDDVAACYTISAGQNISVDLKGHTITCDDGTNSAFMVEAGGTLTVNDTVGGGKVVAAAAKGKKAAAILNGVGGNVTVNGGEFSSANWYTVKNFGTMNIKGGKFAADSSNGENASLIANGWYNGAGTAGDDKGVAHPSGVTANLTIDDGTFNHFMTTLTIKGDDYSNTVINGGTFTSTQGNLVMAAGNVAINGGTFNGYNHLLMLYSDGTAMDPGTATLSGENLTVNAKYLAKTVGGNPTLNVNGGTYNLTEDVFDAFAGTATFTGGTYSKAPSSDYLTIPEGDSIYKNADGTYKIAASPDLSNVPARIIVKAGEAVPVKDTFGLDDFTIANSDFAGNGATYSEGNYTFSTAGISSAVIQPRVYDTEGNPDRSFDKKVKVHVYDVTEVGNKLLPVGETYTIPEGTVSVDAQYDAYEYGIRSEGDETVATLNNGVVTAVNPGTAELYATISIPAVEGMTKEVSLGTIYVYSFDSIDDSYLIRKGEAAQVLVDSTWAATAESDSDNVTVAGTENTFDITGANTGLANVTFAATIGEETKTKTAKFYVYDVANTDVVIEEGHSAHAEDINALIVKGHDDVTLEGVSVADGAVARFSRQDGITIRSNNSGNTTATYRLTVGNKTAEVTLNVHVYNFHASMSATYDLGNEETQTRSFETYDENTEVSEITYTVKDEQGNDATDVAVVPARQNRYRLVLGENARPGTYTVEFVDTIMGGKAVKRASTTVRVHSVEVADAQDSYYIVMSHELGSAADNRFTVSASSNFVNARNLTTSIPSASTFDGVRASNNRGTITVTGRQAGSYTVKISDGYASTTIQVYVIDFTFGQDEYHVNRDDEDPYVLVNAINNYWHEVNASEGRIDTAFSIVNDATDVEVTSGYKSAKIEPAESAQGEDYEFWWCKAENCLEAGDYTVHYTANANGGDNVTGGKTATKNIKLHIYEMVTPEYDTVYLYEGESTTIEFGDKNENASTRASVTDGDESGIRFGGWGYNRDYTRITGREPGVYTVTYRDLMGNGQEVGKFDLRVVVIEVEEETILVRKGTTTTLTGSSAWNLNGATDTTTGTGYTSDSDTLDVDTTNFEVGSHEFTIFHDFTEFDDGDMPPRYTVKEVNMVVYELVADKKTDPEGTTADTIQEFLDKLSKEGLAEALLTSRNYRLSLIATREDAQALFGTGRNEARNALRALRNAINEGETITTTVKVRELGEEDIIDERLTGLIEVMTVDGVKYYDVSVVVMASEEPIAYLHTLNAPITVYIADAEAPAEGYSREYVVVTQHGDEEPEILEEGVGFFIKDGKIYIVSSEFSTYAVAYEDTLIPVTPDTGTFTINDMVNDSENAGASISALVAISLATVIALAGAIKFAKERR